MYNLIALKINCPHCEKSLMDAHTLIDNMPGVKLEVTFDDQHGVIHLSSIYGSYNYTANIKIPLGKEVTFSCPHCKEPVVSELKCDECSAHMVPLKIKDNGLVRICSRAGCKKHNVEFEELSRALEHFYKNFDYGDASRVSESIKETTEKPIDDKEIVETGTFLRTYCPHCEESLYRNKAIEFKIKGKDGEEGILQLSPFLNVFTNESTFYIPEGEPVKNIMCPHCSKDLLRKGEDCPECGEPIVGISVAALSKIIDFYFCSKKGCYWHGMSKEDIDDIILEDSSEW